MSPSIQDNSSFLETGSEGTRGASQQASGLANLFAVLLQPKETFQGLGERPGWVLPLLGSLLVVFAGNFIVIRKLGIAEVLKLSLKSNPQADEIIRMAEQSPATGVMMYAAPALSVPIGILVTAAFFLLLMALAGEETRFRRVFSVVAHSFFAYALVTSALAVVTVLLTGGGSNFDIRNPVASNLGFFLDPEEFRPFWYSLASSFDLLSFWYLVLLSMGFTTVLPKLRIYKSRIMVLSGWLVYVIGRAVVATFTA